MVEGVFKVPAIPLPRRDTIIKEFCSHLRETRRTSPDSVNIYGERLRQILQFLSGPQEMVLRHLERVQLYFKSLQFRGATACWKHKSRQAVMLALEYWRARYHLPAMMWNVIGSAVEYALKY